MLPTILFQISATTRQQITNNATLRPLDRTVTQTDTAPSFTKRTERPKTIVEIQNMYAPHKNIDGEVEC